MDGERNLSLLEAVTIKNRVRFAQQVEMQLIQMHFSDLKNDYLIIYYEFLSIILLD